MASSISKLAQYAADPQLYCRYGGEVRCKKAAALGTRAHDSVGRTNQMGVRSIVLVIALIGVIFWLVK